MWAALIILAQIFGPPQPGGQQDFDVCTGKTENTPLEESIAACHRVVSKEVLDKKSIGEAYYTLAGGLDPAKAISYLDQAIAHDPENGDYYGERGFEYHRLKDYDRALSEYEKALALNPRSSLAYSARARTLVEKGDDAGALADLDRAIAIAQEPFLYTNKAEIYLRQGDTSAALAALDQGLKLNPDHAQFFQDKADVYRKLGDTKQEEAALTRLIALKPKEQLGILLRAFLYEKLGKADLAIADYDSLLGFDPDHKFYRERRAELLALKGGAPAGPAPKVIDAAGDAPPATKAEDAAPELECRVYVPGAGITVSVRCAK